MAECVDAYGDTRVPGGRGRSAGPPGRTTSPSPCGPRRPRARHGAGLPPRLAVVSAADPVDRHTGRLIHLPDAPFLLGELDPAEVLAPVRRAGRSPSTTT